MTPKLTINTEELAAVKCRHGCDDPVGLYHIPEGCNCFPDPVQALCAQHFVKLHSLGSMIWLVARIDTNDARALQAIRIALEHYQHADDGTHNFLKGFAARAGDVNERSVARRALKILDTLEGKRA